jgi:hypothetical protein
MGKIIIGGSAAPSSDISLEPQSEPPTPDGSFPIEIIKEVEKIVEVTVERIVKEVVFEDKPFEVIKEITVEKIVEVPVEVIKVVEKQVEVPVEVIKEIVKEVTVERLVEVPVEVIREVKVIQRIVPKWAMMIAAVEFAIIILLLMSRS